MIIMFCFATCLPFRSLYSILSSLSVAWVKIGSWSYIRTTRSGTFELFPCASSYFRTSISILMINMNETFFFFFFFFKTHRFIFNNNNVITKEILWKRIDEIFIGYLPLNFRGEFPIRSLKIGNSSRDEIFSRIRCN